MTRGGADSAPPPFLLASGFGAKCLMGYGGQENLVTIKLAHVSSGFLTTLDPGPSTSVQTVLCCDRCCLRLVVL